MRGDQFGFQAFKNGGDLGHGGAALEIVDIAVVGRKIGKHMRRPFFLQFDKPFECRGEIAKFIVFPRLDPNEMTPGTQFRHLLNEFFGNFGFLVVFPLGFADIAGFKRVEGGGVLFFKCIQTFAQFRVGTAFMDHPRQG